MLSFAPVSEEEERERKEGKSKQAVQTTLLLSPPSNNNNAKLQQRLCIHSGLPFTIKREWNFIHPMLKTFIPTYAA